MREGWSNISFSALEDKKIPAAIENAPDRTEAVPAIRMANWVDPAACILARSPTVLINPSCIPKTRSRIRPLTSILPFFSSVGYVHGSTSLS